MCLTLKLLQLQPGKEILLEYLLAEEYKYVPLGDASKFKTAKIAAVQ